MRLRILKSVPLLAKLTDTELCSVADALCVQSFEDQDYVIRQGEEVQTCSTCSMMNASVHDCM
jgi:hypothetical protein